MLVGRARPLSSAVFVALLVLSLSLFLSLADPTPINNVNIIFTKLIHFYAYVKRLASSNRR